ncbi:sigma-E factor negative regulatory protein [Rubrivivax gelatinosus]|uniref:RseA-like anti sigma(E) protein n=1 Tax=Rubrivivax gelatinosus TaxID=28068 RepID=A0A4V2SGU8_RUBGE|nr:sigma-E factor negative regulatory protein [Rubrivivax gelatinosus]MBK1688195.1 anti-sigma 24 factor [Rubrivivax gelatinosus]TCP02558.1 RseA-like anti sigma(E) protein [Rubrivivax gelatinosus]
MNPNRTSATSPADSTAFLLSALADGDPSALDEGCSRWRDDPEARRTWHAYQLIGDVMRSEDLANTATHDSAFLAGFRARLADEPVVLAPQPLERPAPSAARVSPRRRHAWLAPAAVAAGFVAVAGVVVVTRMSSLAPSGGAVLADAPPAQPGLSLATTGAAAPRALVVEGRLIRDARLDAYLRAHRDAMAGGPAALPGGGPRNVEVMAPEAAASR